MLGHERTSLHRLIELLGYALLGIFIFFGSVALVFYARGYNYRLRSGEITQNGLILVASEPVEADVFIDGEPTGERTQWRARLPGGEHTIALRRDGYREWRRTFNLGSGEVLWLSYPLLIPQSFDTKEVTRLESDVILAASPDSSRVLTIQDRSVRITRSNDPDMPPVTFSLDSILGRSASGLSVKDVVWSDTNKRLLFSLSNAKKDMAYVYADISSSTPSLRNVTRNLDTYTELRFAPDSDNVLYGVSAQKELWKIELDDSTIAPSLVAEKVDRYAVYGGRAVTWAKDSQRVIYHAGDKSMALNIESLGVVNDLTLSQHDGSTIVAISGPGVGTVIVVNPGETSERIIKRPFESQRLLFSLGASYLAAYSGTEFKVYDVERSRFHDFNLPLEPASQVRWATGAHMLAVVGGQAIIFDFTGDNLQRLGAAADHPVVLSPDQSHVIHVARSGVDGHLMLANTSLEQPN